MQAVALLQSLEYTVKDCLQLIAGLLRSFKANTDTKVYVYSACKERKHGFLVKPLIDKIIVKNKKGVFYLN